MTLLDHGAGDTHDALSLFANLDLSTGASGEAANVSIDQRFGTWVLRLARDRLRLRVIICLGFVSILRNNAAMRIAFESSFGNIDLARPQAIYPFRAYTEKRFLFREWDVVTTYGNPIKVVVWPQHPGRVPMTNADLWKTSCEEFKTRHEQIFIEL
ncbi:MAG: hypothetical protein RIC87_02035 [Kiloniellales bacterium]